MTTLILFFCFLLSIKGQSQEVFQYREQRAGSVKLSKKLSIPYENAGYTLVLPQQRPINGLVVFFNSDRDTLNKIFRYAIPKGFAVAYISTGHSLDFLFEKESYFQLEGYLNDIISQYKIPDSNLLYLGMSLAGTRALKFSLFSLSAESKHHYIPKAIAICDAPLDFVRFWRACHKSKILNFSPVAASEGDWVTSYLESNLDGTPENQLESYINFSPFTYSRINSEQIESLRNIYIRAYTEPDVNWWIDNRRKDYYGMNSIDLAAWINELKIAGHEHASLINTSNKGKLPDGRKHPHSWSIVNEKELIHWFSVISKK